MTPTNLAERRIGLADLHGTCELNFVRLLRLCPDLRVRTSREIRAGRQGQFSLQVEVLERSRFTTAARLSLAMRGLPWVGKQELDLRIYHDARMVEVISSDAQRISRIRYPYPNQAMYLPNEKSQLNQFLGIWLDYFLAEGSTSAPEQSA